MKKTKKTLLTALAFTSAVSLTSCDLFGEVQDLYGPPVADSSESSESSYNPHDDNMQTEYGAPIAYESETTTEETTESTTETTTVTTTDEYDPIREEQTVVYGPPSYFE